MTTTIPAVKSIQRKYVLIDAADQVLGRLATRIAMILRGKHRVTFTPHLDTGDFVIVINASKVKVTGRKASAKLYDRYSGYPGGLKQQTYEEVVARFPDRVMYEAVKGMLPDGPLGRQQLGKLKIYGGPEHPHQAQQPTPLAPTTRYIRKVAPAGKA